MQTMRQLEHMNLPVPMSSAVAWTLNKTHVKVAFRMCVSDATTSCVNLELLISEQFFDCCVSFGAYATATNSLMVNLCWLIVPLS